MLAPSPGRTECIEFIVLLFTERQSNRIIKYSRSSAVHALTTLREASFPLPNFLSSKNVSIVICGLNSLHLKGALHLAPSVCAIDPNFFCLPLQLGPSIIPFLFVKFPVSCFTGYLPPYGLQMCPGSPTPRAPCLDSLSNYKNLFLMFYSLPATLTFRCIALIFLLSYHHSFGWKIKTMCSGAE